jgi:hypothetical protein
MASTVLPSGCRKASYQSPPISAPAAAGTYRTTISHPGTRGGSVSMLRCSASASARCAANSCIWSRATPARRPTSIAVSISDAVCGPRSAELARARTPSV